MSDPVRFDQRLRVPDHVAMRELDGELVLLNYESEEYFGLDEVGTRILEVLREAPSLDDGVARLLQEFDVEADRLRADVEQLVGSLLDGGLVALEQG